MTLFVVGLVCLWSGVMAGIAVSCLVQHAATRTRPRCPLVCPVCADDALLDALHRGHVPDDLLAHALVAWRDTHDIPGDSP